MIPAASRGPDGGEQAAVATYRGGRWHGLVAPGALALLHPDVPADVAGELWQLATEGKRLGAWVEYLAGAGIRALPSFAMVEHHDRGLRVLVRGGVEVVVGEHRIDGRSYATWREEVLDEIGEVLLRAEDGAGHWWPIVAGLVPAAELRASLAAAGPDDDEEDEEDVELTVARMPALAAALRPAAEPAAPPQAVEPVVPPTEARPAPQPAPGGVAVPESAQAPESAPADEDGDDYDHLLWSTEQQATRGAALTTDDGAPGTTHGEVAAGHGAGPPAVEHATDLEATRDPEPDGEEPATGGSAAPDLEQADSPWQPPAQPTATAPPPAQADEARAIIDSVPPWLRAQAGPAATSPPAPSGAPLDLPPPAPAALEPPAAPPAAAPRSGDEPVDTVSTVERSDGDVDGEAGHTVLRPAEHSSAPDDAMPPAPPVLALALSTGLRVDVDRAVLVGRAPEAARFAGESAPRLVRVPNPQKDISATHVEVRPAGDHVVVTDMSSTNGTVVHLADQPSFRLQPGTGVPVPPGATVDLGGLTMVVEGPA